MGSSDSRAPKYTILVTGFGPFSIHEQNASWEAVQLLKKLEFHESINLVVEQIPVEYGFVQENIHNLWDKYKPKLVLHCGVSSLAKHLTLEQQAHNTGYVRVDNKGCLPDESCCILKAPDTLKSGFKMNNICSAINDVSEVRSIVSSDPGSINKERTAFIHVPPIGKPYSVMQLAKALRLVIMTMMEQLINDECSADEYQKYLLERSFSNKM